MHGRCAKMKRVTSIVAKSFCEGCVEKTKGVVTPDELIIILVPGRVCKEFLSLREQAKCQ